MENFYHIYNPAFGLHIHLYQFNAYMPQPYRSIDEITEIFGITKINAKSITQKYKVDVFSNKGKIYIHAKDFYSAYTKHFNPSLFDFGER